MCLIFSCFQGYSAIPAELNFKYLRQIRGDNYCGIRAALYQVLAGGLALPSGHTTHSRLALELTQGATWLREWTFGHRLNYTREEILNGFLDCLDALDSLVSTAKVLFQVLHCFRISMVNLLLDHRAVNDYFVDCINVKAISDIFKWVFIFSSSHVLLVLLVAGNKISDHK